MWLWRPTSENLALAFFSVEEMERECANRKDQKNQKRMASEIKFLEFPYLVL